MDLLTENLINSAMLELGKEHSDFGISGRDPTGTRFNEKFRRALFGKLKEVFDLASKTVLFENKKYPTDNLIGNTVRAHIAAQTDRSMSVVQVHYVTMNVNNEDRKPNDPPALPYDIVLECLKAELIMAPHMKSTSGFVIALTDWPPTWGEGKQPDGWSKNFGKELAQYPVCLEGIITTTGSNPINCIFGQERCHISLSLEWSGRWHGFGENFRYLLLRSNNSRNPHFGHLATSDDTLPFLTLNARKAFLSRREEFLAQREAAKRQ